jgi:LuxR family transcriptional regulator, maltose regulon positive regulatory protein
MTAAETALTLLPHTLVEAWLLEASLAVIAEERPAARHALKTALVLAEPLQAIRPFALAGPEVLDLLEHERRSLGALDEFADRALAAGHGRVGQQAILSGRELDVLGMLPSMLSLDEIAAALMVSVNTVKSHVHAIFSKLGVSSRRCAVLTAHERGLLKN